MAKLFNIPKIPSATLPLFLAVLKNNVKYKNKRDRWRSNNKRMKARTEAALDLAIAATRDAWLSDDEVQRILGRLLNLVMDISSGIQLSPETQRWCDLVEATRGQYDYVPSEPKPALATAE